MSTTDSTTSAAARQRFLARINRPWLMRLFFLRQLPTLLWWGVRVVRVTEQTGQVALPYGKRTQNPFRSTYFAAQAGAAELSTGLLAMTHLEGQPRVSMLVTQLTGIYTKKADSRITFTCQDGDRFAAIIAAAVATGDPQTLTALSIGTLADGTEVSRHEVTWSFKRKR